jgi:hypothetical protein
LGFLNWTFDVGVFTLYWLSVEFYLGFFFCIWAFYYSLAFFNLGFSNWAFEVGLLPYMGFWWNSIWNFFCIWAIYCSLAFGIWAF